MTPTAQPFSKPRNSDGRRDLAAPIFHMRACCYSCMRFQVRRRCLTPPCHSRSTASRLSFPTTDRNRHVLSVTCRRTGMRDRPPFRLVQAHPSTSLAEEQALAMFSFCSHIAGHDTARFSLARAEPSERPWVGTSGTDGAERTVAGASRCRTGPNNYRGHGTSAASL